MEEGETSQYEAEAFQPNRLITANGPAEIEKKTMPCQVRRG